MDITKLKQIKLFMEEHEKNGFPVTIVIQPSTVYGPKLGLFRQVASTDFLGLIELEKENLLFFVTRETPTSFYMQMMQH